MLKDNYKTSKGVFVVHRLKRLDSITAKLKRIPGMSLFGMQDIGGCRVVMANVKQVYDVAEKYQTSRIRHILYKENDYISKPKASGYRSLHRVYKYVSDKKDSYNKMCIEIQFRTKLQHIWATAVETMGIYTRTNLKAGIGNEVYLRFFALVSSLFAMEEKCPTVPNTPTDIDELVKEIRKLNKEYSILAKLETIRKSIRIAEKNKSNKGKYFLLELNLQTKELTITNYKTGEINKANDKYNYIEGNSGEDTDVVLVSATSFAELHKAYPNYFADVKAFIDKVRMKVYND
jgi:ppGpp synthetase/RelA/SpoT-type nucleotidyltranferase